ncbi:MAG: hypothetical protein M1297_05770 [Nitrospirae bacterium]|jgi:hypothetical protein|nr:hypothetical protein [Nitrospirota bacterium]
MFDRRQFLKGLGWAFAAGVSFCLTPEGKGLPRAWGKPVPGTVDKKTARYRNHPEDGKMCMNCTHFIPPKGMGSMMEHMGQGMENMGGMQGMSGSGGRMKGACTVVAGPVSPMGYCRFYMRKT